MPDPKRPIPFLSSMPRLKEIIRPGRIGLLYRLGVFVTVISLIAVIFYGSSAIPAPFYFLLTALLAVLLVLQAAAWFAIHATYKSYRTDQRDFRKVKDRQQRPQEETAEKLLEREKELRNALMDLSAKEEEIKRQSVKLKEVRQQVQDKTSARSEFLSMMSHEIRTPMNGIMGMTNLLVRNNPREDQLEQLEVLDHSVKSLMSTITDLLDYSRMKSGKIKSHSLTFSLPNLVGEVLEDFRLTADKSHITLYSEIEEGLPEKVKGDPIQLTQILNNLLSNALKFTLMGEVGLTVKKLAKEEKAQRLLFTITDTGVGIARENRERIFEEFVQEETGDSRLFGGAGLGLTICKKLVELNGGRIYVESEKNEGSSFHVELLFQQSEGAKSDPASDIETKGVLQGMKVLLAEDNPVNQKVVQRFLEKWEVQVLLAENGEQALQTVQREEVDLVLMDLQMPVMDGYTATRQIRNLDDPKRSSLPILAITAASLQEVREKVLEAGMNDCLAKPFNPEQMEHTLKQYFTT